MKKIARTAVLALVAMGAVAIATPAHAGIFGSEPMPPVNLPPHSSIVGVVINAVIGSLGI
ncbi:MULTISPECIES: hypothetical protein [Acidobacterium]|uniref:Lipoprotein n=1 Tax=Acidobacterium capsulatum (strain ATCC 51196 / DSM 11244 / BCRC 80197 / JCM 7670 / NBRC 15755 / NCIMB 13165 / 161) TaxID=240015 RepID=C1F7W3_ACIC5|nr:MULTISPECIES: hypothetical protein [Acidobacterium]ACO33369.1 hypothetical protein ACP_0006 [Acidobacterium capsulatum ATCC 51196]HCT59342.1 hypothetical protein [Acidobacterium sp.]